MGKGSLAKIAAALAIISVYIFLLGFTGRIESLEKSIPIEERLPDETKEPEETRPDEDNVPVVTTTAPAEEKIVYTYSTTLNVVNVKKPTLVDYTATQAIMIIPETTTTTSTTADVVLDDSSFETTPSTSLTTVPPETTEETTTAAAETAAEVSDTTTTASTAAETTSVPDAATAPEETTTAGQAQDTSEATEPPETSPASEETTAPPEIEDDIGDLNEATEPDGGQTAPIPASSEKLSVLANGKVVTGDAVSIVAQAVMAEIGDSFHDEAIKAQAIATYTYLKFYNLNNKNAGAVLKTPSDNVTRCVSEVIGKAIYYKGSMIQAVYCASSAGYTASSLNVWGVDYPYLQSRRNDFDVLYDINYGRQVTFTSEQVRTFVKNNAGINLNDDPSTWFEITSYVDGSYVGTMTIGGQETYNAGGSEKTITGRAFREVIMEYNLRSSSFDITYSPAADSFTFTTYGYGHGVGLSQHGANILATNYGYNYEEIIKYYFQGTDIS